MGETGRNRKKGRMKVNNVHRSKRSQGRQDPVRQEGRRGAMWALSLDGSGQRLWLDNCGLGFHKCPLGSGRYISIGDHRGSLA